MNNDGGNNDGGSVFVIEKSTHPLAAEEREQQLQNPVFGKVYTDHLAMARYTTERGWHDAKIVPRRMLELAPSAQVLHYAQEIFEGLKAYRMPDGGVALFRPAANARRFQTSAARLAMPPLPESLFLGSVRELVRLERDWVPRTEGATLYLRPFMIATEAQLGMRASNEFLYCVVASPVGTYFKGGAGAIRLWVSEKYIRAAPGGTGDAKCGGNYAASLIAQTQAVREGCDQAVFLDAVERRWVEELGGMNVFFVFDDGSIVTPPLTGTILAGVTRDSLITLARDMGMVVREEPYAIDQWRADAQSGRLREAFACGTAVVVTAIGEVKWQNSSFTIGDGGTGPIASRLRGALLAIQQGHGADPYGWRDILC